MDDGGPTRDEHSAYSLSVHGVSWLHGAGTFFRQGGATYATSNKTLRLARPPSNDSGSDSFGLYQGRSWAYAVDGRSVETGVRTYLTKPVVVFSQVSLHQWIIVYISGHPHPCVA